MLYIVAGASQLGAPGIGALAKAKQILIMGTRFETVSRQLGRTGSAGDAVEAVRSDFQRRLVGRQRVRAGAGLEQQVPKQLSSGEQRARGHRVFADRIL